jgi:molybdopterin-guanine dinucleotide biosynthesis protein A
VVRDDVKFDAIVLAGGAATRMGGVDKPMMHVAGKPMLERVIDAVSAAQSCIVVGPRRELPTATRVRWVHERPCMGGPLAAIAAAIPYLGADRVVLLAADMPWIAEAVPTLVRSVAESAVDAALLRTGDRDNYLAAAWRREKLTAALASAQTATGGAVRSLYRGLRVVRIADPHGWGRDCDTTDQLHAANCEMESRRARTAPPPTSAQPTEEEADISRHRPGDAVADAMIRYPKCSDRAATVADMRRLLDDDHVHAALIVDRGRLLAVIERSDLGSGIADDAPAYLLGRLADRVVAATEPLKDAHRRMQAAGQRRLAVTGADGDLLGLLCLKRSGTGFCTDQGIRDRAGQRYAGRSGHLA